MPAPTVRPGVRLDALLTLDGEVLKSRLRAPREVRTEATENRYVADQVDTVRTYVYDGLELELYDVTDGPAFVRRLAITGGDYGTSDGLSVGTPRDEMEATLGPPIDETGGTVTYTTGAEPTPTLVEVLYEADADGVARASEIVWLPYVD